MSNRTENLSIASLAAQLAVPEYRLHRLLSLTGLISDMLNDPPGFDRRELPALDRKVANFFERHLLAPAPAGRTTP